MYEVSDKYKEAIRGHTRKFKWSGTITTTAGKVYHFTEKDIVKGSGTITRSCSGSTSLEMGSVYAAELDISLFLNVDRYSLYDAVIDLFFSYQHPQHTWNDLKKKTWGELLGMRWRDLSLWYDSEEIPLGRFVVSEATRTLTVLQLKSYDFMLKFEKSVVSNGSSKTAFQWLQFACNKCGVELGMTEEEVAALPNGDRTLSFTINDDVKTFRDLISHVATALCGVCQIDRQGCLVIIPFSNTPVMDIPASWRYSSRISDFTTRYTGLYATYYTGGLTEYFHTDPDDGLIYNIGTNVFLQISSATERQKALQAVIDNLSLITYTPFEAEIPSDPSLDPMDVLSFSGGQANGEIACITEIVIKINGKTSIKCVGENPRLVQAKSRYTKDIEGLIASNMGSEGSSSFWLSDASSSTSQVVGETETSVIATQFEIQTDKGRGGIIWTGSYYLDADGEVVANVYLDDELIYSCRDYRPKGYTTLTVSTPFEIQRGDEGIHEARITLACTESDTSEIADLLKRVNSLEIRIRQMEDGFDNEISVEDPVHVDNTAMIGGILPGADTEIWSGDKYTISEPVVVDFTAALSGGILSEVESEAGVIDDYGISEPIHGEPTAPFSNLQDGVEIEGE